MPVVNSSTCQPWNITKYDYCIHHIYHHTHHILWQYHITSTPCKNKLDASNLLIAYFTWLMGVTLKNGSYLCKATLLILELPKSYCKSNDNYSGRYRHPPAAYVEQATAEPVSWTRSCKVGLGRFNPTMTTSRSTRKETCTNNINTHKNIVVFYSCKTYTHRSGSDTSDGFHNIENKKLPRNTHKREPRSDLQDAKQWARERLDLYTLVDRTAETFRWTWSA
jgi:hypothetical protein